MEALLKNAIFFCIIFALTIPPKYHYTAAVKCYACFDTKHPLGWDKTHKNCIEGGIPISPEKYYTELDCNSTDSGIDGNSCLINLEFYKKGGAKGSVYEMYKHCFNSTFYKCLQKSPEASKKGNCVVLSFDDFEKWEAKCGHTHENITVTEEERSELISSRSQSHDPAFVAYCTCEGEHCNRYLSEEDYAAMEITSPWEDPSSSTGHWEHDSTIFIQLMLCMLHLKINH